MNEERAKQIFGEEGRQYILLAIEFEDQLPRIAYQLGSEEELDGVDPATEEGRRAANQIIWRDQLTKAHIAASSTIIRSARWIRGMYDGHVAGNLMAFGACFRGLIEASADSFDSLRNVPLNLAKNFQVIRECLNGDRTDLIFRSPEIEEILDHYIYAQKQPRGFQGPAHLRAKTAREYVTSLQEAETGKIVDAYSDLCEITHPASLSVTAFLEKREDGTLSLAENAEKECIDLLIDEYQVIIPRTFRLSLNPAFMTLRVINLLPVPDLQVPFADTLNFDNFPDWIKAKEDMGIE